MIEFIITWRYLLIALGWVILFAIFKWEQFKVIAMGFIYDAEELAKKKILENGKAKEDWVLLALKFKFPRFVTFVGEDKIREIIRGLIQLAKKYTAGKTAI